MNIDAFIETDDRTPAFHCKYYHDPERWNEASPKIKSEINALAQALIKTAPAPMSFANFANFAHLFL